MAVKEDLCLQPLNKDFYITVKTYKMIKLLMLSTMNQAFLNFLNFLWAVAIPKGKMEKSQEEEINETDEIKTK